MATMQDLDLSPLTKDLLRENGRLDRRAGKGRDEGWQELARAMGYSDERTPAREAYEDGWYTGTAEE